MANQWFFARDGRKYGPFSTDRLKAIAARGQLRPEDTVWKQGIERGVLGAKVRGLFPAAAGKDLPVRAAALAGNGPASSHQPADGPSSQSPAPASVTSARPGSSEAEATPRGPTVADIGEELAPLQDLWEPPDSAAEEEDEEAPPIPRPRSGARNFDKEGTVTSGNAGPAAQQEEKKKGRVISIKGGIISNQDGRMVRYRKKCLKCGLDDRSISTMQIRSGVTRLNFFCPKCRKNQQVEIQGIA